jgi:hypothetical protein
MTEGAGVKKDRKNELRKLAATFFNNLAVGCVLLELIGPVATGKFAHVFTGEFVYTEGAAWVLAAVFHTIARRQLWFLEERAAGLASSQRDPSS